MTEALQALVLRARRGANDPELVIGTSKKSKGRLLATFWQKSRHVLVRYGFRVDPFHGFDRLGLATPKTTDKLDDDPYRELQLAIHHVGRAVNRLRKDRGDGHGRPTPPVATALEAQLTSIGAALVSQLLLPALKTR